MTGRARSLAARIAWIVGKVVIGLALASALLLTLVFLGLRLPVLQKVVAKQTNAALAELFRGHLVIDQLGLIGPSGVRNLSLRVFDPQGRVVLNAQGVQVDYFWPSLVWQTVVLRPAALSIEIEKIRIDHLDLRLIDDGTGTPTLVNAFDPAEPGPPSPESAEVRVVIPEVRLEHGWIHGKLGTLPAIDAETRELRGRFGALPEETEIDLSIERLVVRALPGALNPTGKLAARLRFPSAAGGLPNVAAKLDGTLAQARTVARFKLDRGIIHATLEVQGIQPKAIQELVPTIQLKAPLDLHAQASGPVEALRVEATAAGPAARVVVQGDLRLGEETQVELQVAVSDLDLSGLLADGPESRLQIEAELDAHFRQDTAFEVRYRISSPAGQLARVTLPPIQLQGTVESGEGGAVDGRGTVQVAEPGLATELAISLHRLGREDALVEVSGQVHVNHPKRFSEFATGRGELSLAARIQPALSSFDASVSASLSAVQSAELRTRQVRLSATASGTLTDPRFSAQIHAADISALERRFERGNLALVGSQELFEIHGELRGGHPDWIRFRTRASLKPELTLHEPEVLLNDGKRLRLVLRAEAIAISQRSIGVRALELSGAGEARASLIWSKQVSKLELTTNQLEPARILTALGIDSPLKSGILNLSAQYEERPSGPWGKIRGTIDSLGIEQISGGHVGLDLSLADRKISGSIVTTMRGSQVWLHADAIRIPDPPYDAPALERVHGALSARGSVDLARIQPLLARALPLSSARGTLAFQLHASRPPTGPGGPQVTLQIDSSQLQLVGRRTTESSIPTTETARATKPWSLEKMDVSANLELDAGAGVARLGAVLKDAAGDLLVLQASARPERTDRISALIDRDLTRIPVQGRLKMPPRAIQRLPEILRVTTIQGVAAFDASFEGTVQNPELSATGTFSSLRTLEMDQGVDLSVFANYQPSGGDFRADASVTRTRIGAVQARWTGDLMQLSKVADLSQPSPIRGELGLSLTEFPLELLPALANRNMRGRVTGSAELSGFGEDAQGLARFETNPLLVGQVGVPKLDVLLEARPGKLLGRLDLRGRESLAQAQLEVPIRWGRRLLPEVENRLQGRLVARNFRLETLAPLLTGQINELEGRLDAQIEAQITDDKPRLKGWAAVRRGVVHIPIIGQRFRGIEAKLQLDEGRARLERLTARGITGRLKANGTAKLDGVDLRSAEVHLRIDRRESIPVTLEGSAIGDAWGKVDVVLDRSTPRKTSIRVDVPQLTLDMPENDPAALQDLDEPEQIRVGTRLADGDFVTLPVQPLEGSASRAPATQTELEVNLGRSVWLRRGRQLEVQLAGRVLLRQGLESTVNGTIELQGGTLDVQGKRFEIERGVVTFIKDPSNPTITAVARWDSPESYSVYAEYAGTAQEGKLTLRSEPPLTDNEILTLLMFGTPDGTFGSGQGSGNAQAALGVAGGTAAQGLNRVLSNITDLEVSARMDTSTGTARPELVVQLSPRVTARVTRAVGEPSIGQSPDRTTLTLDLRLFKAWSLSTAVGDRGASALDLVWRKRY